MDNRQPSQSVEKLLQSEGTVGGGNWASASANSYGAQQMMGDEQLARGLADAAPKKDIPKGTRLTPEKHHGARWWVTPMVYVLAGAGSLLILSAGVMVVFRVFGRSQVEREQSPMLYELPPI